MPKSQEYCHGRRRRSIIDLFYLCCQKILQKKLTTSILRPSLRNSLEIGRLPREVNNKNTYEDGDYLMVSLVDGEGTAVVVHVQNQNEHNWL